jgi:hypothetical protein
MAAPGGANPLASVPWVAQWKFNNNALDSIGANNLSPSASSPTFTAGKLGGATGATHTTEALGQYWDIGDNPALSAGINVDISVAAWVYLDSKPAHIMGIASKGNNTTSAGREYSLHWNNTFDRFAFDACDGATTKQTFANSFGAPALATWYLVIGWYEKAAGTVNICVNNGAVDSVGGAGLQDTLTSFEIGWLLRSVNRFWDGRIDNVCIAKSAGGAGGVLTAAQRTAFWNGGAGTEVLT